jgi:hypothetical protein
MKEESGSARLAVPAETLKALGWSALEARIDPSHQLLAPLLEELRSEECVHTWRHHLPLTGPILHEHTDALKRSEEAHRPTRTFAYVAIELDGKEIIAAAGSVSDKIRHDFPYDGFPVTARCYIRAMFRKRGLYRHVLGHRLEDCLRRLGSNLKAIHLGSANPQVWESVALHGGFPLTFVHIGDEDLEVRSEVHRIPALLAFHPDYKKAVLEASRSNGFDQTFRDALRALISGHSQEADWGGIRELAEVQHTDIQQPYPTELEELFALGDAIPLKR